MIGLAIIFFERIWILGLCIRKAVEHFKCCLIGHTSRSMEDSGDKCYTMYSMNFGYLEKKKERERERERDSYGFKCHSLLTLPSSSKYIIL